MKRLFSFFFVFVLILSMIGCSQISTENLEDLEIFKSLKNAIGENDSLEEIVNTFGEVCKPLLDNTDNRYQYETIAYDVDGVPYLKLHLATQFKVPIYTGKLQLNLVLVYQVEEDMTTFEENKWFDGDFDTFIDYIKDSQIFGKLIGKTLDSHNITIERV